MYAQANSHHKVTETPVEAQTVRATILMNVEKGERSCVKIDEKDERNSSKEIQENEVDIRSLLSPLLFSQTSA